jgi:hypothetical protein
MRRISVHHPAELQADVEAGDKEVNPATCERKCGSVLCDGRRAHVPEAHWTFTPACAECERCLVGEFSADCAAESRPCAYRIEVL